MHTRIKWIIAVLLAIPLTQVCEAQAPPCAGLGMHMGNLYQLSEARTRSISPENFTGEKGKGGMATLEEGTAAHAARELGQGWKVNPFINKKNWS